MRSATIATTASLERAMAQAEPRMRLSDRDETFENRSVGPGTTQGQRPACGRHEAFMAVTPVWPALMQLAESVSIGGLTSSIVT
jgi:hypothetical protein